MRHEYKIRDYIIMLDDNENIIKILKDNDVVMEGRIGKNYIKETLRILKLLSLII